MAFQSYSAGLPNEFTPPQSGVNFGDVAEQGLLRRIPNPVGPQASRRTGPRGFESHRLRRFSLCNPN